MGTAMTANDWVETLNLKRHPEGGHFRETYRAEERIPVQALPERFSQARNLSTAIYFLLSGTEFSAFHRIRSDELWHFYAGGTLLLHSIDARGVLTRVALGPNPGRGETPQAVVPAGCWFAAELKEPGAFALVGCTVAPGFDFADLELGDGATLCAAFPAHAALLRRLTR